jgi:hypothetical protein
LQPQPPKGSSAFETGPWQPWFAWRPVRLFGTSRIAWGQNIFRRAVRRDYARPLMDYSDTPARFPSGKSDPMRWSGE